MDNTFYCSIVPVLWIPLVALGLIGLIILLVKYKKSDDWIAQRKIKGLIKYPLILTLIGLLYAPLVMFGLDDVLESQCTTTPTVTKPDAKHLTTFHGGANNLTVLMPSNGGFNSDLKIEIPSGAKIKSSEIELIHEPSQVWNDEFKNLKKVESDTKLEINKKEGYITLKSTYLEVTEEITLSGTHRYDEVVIKKGGAITVPAKQTLELIVDEKLTIEEGGGINADGRPFKPESDDYRDRANKEAGGGGAGGHGGKGGDGGNDLPYEGGKGSYPHDIETDPTMPGYSGGNGGGCLAPTGSEYPGTGGFGGGAVIIKTKRLQLDGYITANGGDGQDSFRRDGSGGGGAGGGGSVNINVSEFIFNGRISANGGKGGDDLQSNDITSDGSGGGGGGGRVAIQYFEKRGTGQITVNGGNGGYSSDPEKRGQDGGKGSIYWSKKKDQEVMIIERKITSLMIAPDNIDEWEDFYANSTEPGGSQIEYRILSTDTGKTLCRISSSDAQTGYDIKNCTKGYERLNVQANIVTVSFQRIPRIYEWGLKYKTHIRDFKVDLGIDQVVEYKNESFSNVLELNDNNTQPKLTNQINKLTNKCDCRGCIPTRDYCVISLRFASKTGGEIIARNLNLTFV